MSNAVPPSVTYPSPTEWLPTVYAISGISRDARATITCSTYGFTADDEGITQVTFKQVQGMLPINGITALITQVVDSTHFIVQVDTTNFPSYSSGGVICIDTGQPPVERVGSQTFNTPYINLFDPNT